METETKNVLDLQAIILAAGTSSRFKTGKTKLLEPICGRPMILYPTQVLRNLKIPTLMVVGFQREDIEETIKQSLGQNAVTFIHQKEQLGTGHAIQCTKDSWQAEHILVMNGDMPLVNEAVIEKLLKKHIQKDSTITFITAYHCDPNAMYGRVITGNDTIQIIEAKEFEGDLSEQCCVNAGVYLIRRDFLEKNLLELKKSPTTKEWYITDLIKIASDSNLKVETLSVPFDVIRGVNDFKELWAAEQIKKSEIVQHWMHNGVRFSIAHNVQIDWDVTIGAGTFIDSGVQLLSGTSIGMGCSIGSFSVLKNAIIADRCVVQSHTIVEKATLESDVIVGPFAYIHGNSFFEQQSKVGCFVEINRSSIGQKTKIKHLSYIGDAHFQEKVNVGAGTIVCNYDGIEKHRTLIKSEAFIGGNSTVIAPVVIGKGAMVAAGSTINKDVPDDALAIARQHQINKENYTKKFFQRKKESHFIGAHKITTETSEQQ